MSDSFNMIYGHHMDQGKMFGEIADFTEEEYFNSHKTGKITLKDGSSYSIDFFACVETTAYDNAFLSR